ncbi:class I SAM-dependent methyltransferase [Sulfurimonas sp.]|jgi:SAM-dependent methyltransferase|uniref:class I SAM-dependent DNA methyltransferase n=1 Tax=Sulfurimonas sp. TaxID=2022749 RepID=UPI0025D7E4BE|nr:class I SAM-dependent methyltransferase [Sulfurimonas sp.]MCK9472190.1 class I SAM-dependent methyltransferase [Sulfurimonas sp.]MDD3504966.1 class I SAM-dependent methyltransferase [Sulfurimonas sp.]
MNKCICCGESVWLPLKNPHKTRSITTSGVIINEKLGKAQCQYCGLVQRVYEELLANTDFYEKNYTGYYTRISSAIYQPNRYQKLINLIVSEVHDKKIKYVLEIGCGNGSAMEEFKKVLPAVEIEGIEPSSDNANIAMNKGLTVFKQKFTKNFVSEKKYDLIYANHVIQHTTNPEDFLEAIYKNLNNEGIAIIIVNDSSFPNNELLFSDQNYSFLPENLVQIANNVGFVIENILTGSNKDELLYSQMLVCRKSKINTPFFYNSSINLELLYKKRNSFLQSWEKIDEFLTHRTCFYKNVYNFGAGMYTWLTAAYCENYWKKVTKCVVDDGEGILFDKKVEKLDLINTRQESNNNSCIVINIRENLVCSVKKRLEYSTGMSTIAYNNFIEYK